MEECPGRHDEFRQSGRQIHRVLHQRSDSVAMLRRACAQNRPKSTKAPDAQRPTGDGSEVAERMAMSFAAVVDRVRAEFVEMPGLELTLPQAVRLWSLGMDDCRFVIDALVDAGFLKWTTRRTVIRTGRNLPVGIDLQSIDVPVLAIRRSDKSVWIG
jgi:hypothetical protein